MRSSPPWNATPLLEMIFTALYGRRAFKPNLGSDGYFGGGKEAHANNAALRPSLAFYIRTTSSRNIIRMDDGATRNTHNGVTGTRNLASIDLVMVLSLVPIPKSK